MSSFVTESPAQTRALAARVARTARPGDVILLTGDLGTGKTTFVQGFAEELGVADRPSSPTFVILQLYRGGRLPMAHADLYRLEDVAAIESTGLEEVLVAPWVTLIEWGERLPASWVADVLTVKMSQASGDVRHITLEPSGDWTGRCPV